MKITSLRPLHCARVRLSQTSLLIPFHNILCNILIKFHVRCVWLVGWCVCTGLIIVYVARDQSSNPAKAEFYFEIDVCCDTHNIMFINV